MNSTRNRLPPGSIGEARQTLSTRLQETGQDDADTVAEQVLADLLGVRPLDIHLYARASFPSACRAALFPLAERLLRQEPIQYVLGHAEFMGRRFRTDPRALIPRPETEQLVESALREPVITARPLPRLADVGTGCGIVAISLALALPQAKVLAVDNQADALTLARENARLHGVESRIEWRKHDLLSEPPVNRLDLVVANLPYVPTAQWEQLPARVRKYEPQTALDGGEKGITLIARLSLQAKTALGPGGVLLLEIGEDQGPSVQSLLRRNGYDHVDIRRDLAGHPRIARAVRK